MAILEGGMTVLSMVSNPRIYKESLLIPKLDWQLDKENPGTGNIRGLNLAAVKPTTVQVSNYRFLGVNKLRHKLLHYPALTDVPVYSV
jgi:hypothetical protein